MIKNSGSFSSRPNYQEYKQIVQPEEFPHYSSKIFYLAGGICKEKVLLHFGAVDQECQGISEWQEGGSHQRGGYLPSFSFDITELLTDGENVLTFV